MPPSLGNTIVEEIFCSGEVKFHGQPLGMIIADTFANANKAAQMVKVTYEKIMITPSEQGIVSGLLNYIGLGNVPKPILPTMQDVFNAKAMDRIDESEFVIVAEKEGVDVAHSLNGNFEMGSQYHFTMETQRCICVPVEDGMTVYSATQWIDLVQQAIAECLKVPENTLNLEVRRLGGGYGAKISRASQIACASALACHLLNRPVRMLLTLESNMTAIGKRFACINDYSVDVDDNGKIQKLKNDFYQDLGCSANENPIDYSASMFKNVYDNSTWTVLPKAVNTDSPTHTYCRSPSTTEGIAMIENIMEHIARVTKKNPEDVRLANMPDNHPVKKMYKDFMTSVGERFELIY